MHIPGHRRVHRRCENSVSSTLQSAYVTINIYCLQLRNYIAYIWHFNNLHKGIIKDSIASQKYATPRDFAVNNVTLHKWRHLIKGVLNYDNEDSNYRDCTSVLGHDSKGSNDRGCTSGHIYPPLTRTHPTRLLDSVFKLVCYLIEVNDTVHTWAYSAINEIVLAPYVKL